MEKESGPSRRGVNPPTAQLGDNPTNALVFNPDHSSAGVGQFCGGGLKDGCGDGIHVLLSVDESVRLLFGDLP